MRWTVPQSTSLLDELARIFPESSRGTLRGWIELGRILVAGRLAAGPKQPIEAESIVELLPRKVALTDGLALLYEDDQIVVVDKPERLLSVDLDEGNERSVHSILKRRFNKIKIYPVHRIDRDTSGVLIFAYTEEARDRLKEMFAEHDLEREYCAVVHSTPKAREGTWESFLVEGRDLSVRSVATSLQHARQAITHYRVLAKVPAYSALALRLETGRKHQIRAHCAEQGCPVVGDARYAPGRRNRAGRLCLHAAKLTFAHPITGKRMSFTSPIPLAFYKLVPTLRRPDESIPQFRPQS